MSVRTENSQYNKKIIRINSESPDLSIIRRAASVIRKGGVVVFPARSMYGLAADAFNPDAINRIYEIKRRVPEKPLLILVPEDYDLSEIAAGVSENALEIMKKFWPGGVTVILDAKGNLPQRLTAGTLKIGVRYPGHPVAALLAKYAGCPVTGTSANISENGSCTDIADLDSEIMEKADMILDTGKLAGGAGSTIVDTSGGFVKILREGSIPSRLILDIIQKI